VLSNGARAQDIQKRIVRLRAEVAPDGSQPRLKTLMQVLSGSVNVQVNGGVAEVRSCARALAGAAMRTKRAVGRSVRPSWSPQWWALCPRTTCSSWPMRCGSSWCELARAARAARGCGLIRLRPRSGDVGTACLWRASCTSRTAATRHSRQAAGPRKLEAPPAERARNRPQDHLERGFDQLLVRVRPLVEDRGLPEPFNKL
jgi:hypothetical protein